MYHQISVSALIIGICLLSSNPGLVESEELEVTSGTLEVAETTEAAEVVEVTEVAEVTEAAEVAEDVCSEIGFFRSVFDCTAFYRCVDFYANGHFTKFDFVCPEELVFDETLSVCNWPWASAPCEDVTTAAPEIDTTEESGSGDGEEGEVTTAGAEIDTAEEEEGEEDASSIDDTIVVVAPTFGFECANAGLFPHETNCEKFWLCKGTEDNLEPSELYRCPDGYLFDEGVLRCLKEETVECDKVSDMAQERFETAITLREEDLESFFLRWSN